ncbi:hypothetical protein BPY_14100 [Bifidobacterium psychraerophilum]
MECIHGQILGILRVRSLISGYWRDSRQQHTILSAALGKHPPPLMGRAPAQERAEEHEHAACLSVWDGRTGSK